jgi:hypothetical protein
MQHSTGTPTAAQRVRFERIRELGCIACRMRGLGLRVPEIHHLTITGRHGGKRAGHDATVGLCAWHHRGVPFSSMAAADTEAMAGPSLARTPRRFREVFGQDAQLLEYQNQLLDQRYGNSGPLCARPGTDAEHDRGRNPRTLLSQIGRHPEGLQDGEEDRLAP